MQNLLSNHSKSQSFQDFVGFQRFSLEGSTSVHIAVELGPLLGELGRFSQLGFGLSKNVSIRTRKRVRLKETAVLVGSRRLALWCVFGLWLQVGLRLTFGSRLVGHGLLLQHHLFEVTDSALLDCHMLLVHLVHPHLMTQLCVMWLIVRVIHHLVWNTHRHLVSWLHVRVSREHPLVLHCFKLHHMLVLRMGVVFHHRLLLLFICLHVFILGSLLVPSVLVSHSLAYVTYAFLDVPSILGGVFILVTIVLPNVHGNTHMTG